MAKDDSPLFLTYKPRKYRSEIEASGRCRREDEKRKYYLDINNTVHLLPAVQV